MEYIKNISNGQLALAPLGIILNVNEERLLSEVANRSKLQDYSNYLNDLIYQDKISLLDANRDAFRKSQAVQYFSNAFHTVVIDNELTNQSKSYYFVKDSLDIKKNDIAFKFFSGRVKTLHVYPSDNKLDVKIITGDGLVMPVESLLKRQTLEFDFNSDIRDMLLIFEASSPVNVDVFIEGYNTEYDLSDLQKFIWSWDDDHTSWKTQDLVLSVKKNNKNVSISKSGTTVIVNDNSSNYHLYKISDKVVFLEHVTNGKWNNLSSNRVSCILKNAQNVQFSNQTILVSSLTKTKQHYIGDEE